MLPFGIVGGRFQRIWRGELDGRDPSKRHYHGDL